VKFGVAFAFLNPRYYVEAAREAEALGFESIWMSEHLVLPVEMRGELIPGEEHPPIPASLPIVEPIAALCHVAAVTERVKLGTFVYLLAIRHPFVGARAFATLDAVSNGRALAGVGAGWLETEWEAAGFDPRTRGRRLDEAIDVARRLWTDETVEHHGEFYDFAPVMFEPKPVQKPHPPIIVGGESERALRRAASLGDGWIGVEHTPESVVSQVARLRELRAEHGSASVPLEVSVAGVVRSRDDVVAWSEAGVDRVIVAPWRRSDEAVEGLRRFARRVF
jgi:probable F420-dependent oxidoreductase